MQQQGGWGKLFLSTPSARRATCSPCPRSDRLCYFYPRPPRGGRPVVRAGDAATVPISIHALREEGDSSRSSSYVPQSISIHALREEGDAGKFVFQVIGICISIHALREEGDEVAVLLPVVGHNFYPRPPRGGRPVNPARRAQHRTISIHALREEGDAPGLVFASSVSKFLSTPSARRATGGFLFLILGELFLSTPSARRATVAIEPKDSGRAISIHALREEGDRFPGLVGHLHVLFLSTPSARRATARREPLKGAANISIHALREEGDGSQTAKECQL